MAVHDAPARISEATHNYPGRHKYHNQRLSSIPIPTTCSMWPMAVACAVPGNQGASWVTGLSLYQLKSLQFITNGLNAVVAGGYGTLYAARDTDLDNWYSLKGNLPNTFVWQMDYSSRDDTLAVGTLGRGAFTLANASTLMPATPSSVDHRLDPAAPVLPRATRPSTAAPCRTLTR